MRFVVNVEGKQDSRKEFKLSAKLVRINRRGKSEHEKSLGHIYLNTSELVSESTNRNQKWKIREKRSPADSFLLVHASISCKHVKERTTHGERCSEDSEISEMSSHSETEETGDALETFHWSLIRCQAGVTEIKTSTDFLHSSLTYPSPSSMPLDFETIMNSVTSSTPELSPNIASDKCLFDSVSPQSRSDDNNSPLNFHEKTFKKYQQNFSKTCERAKFDILNTASKLQIQGNKSTCDRSTSPKTDGNTTQGPEVSQQDMDLSALILMKQQCDDLERTLGETTSRLHYRQNALQINSLTSVPKQRAISEYCLIQDLKGDVDSALGITEELELDFRKFVEQQAASSFSSDKVKEFFIEFDVSFSKIDISVNNLQQTVVDLSSKEVMSSVSENAMHLRKRIEKIPIQSEQDQYSNFDANPSGHVEYVLSDDRNTELSAPITVIEDQSALISSKKKGHEDSARVKELEKQVERFKKLLDVEAQVSKSRKVQVGLALGCLSVADVSQS
eukprot:759570-Hanusia_phi.AAC.4